MLTCHCCTAQRYSSYNDALTSTGQHKNKADLTHSPVYYPFASTHMVNTHLLHVQMCIQNIANIFAGFLIRAWWVFREIREHYCTANITTFTVDHMRHYLLWYHWWPWGSWAQQCQQHGARLFSPGQCSIGVPVEERDTLNDKGLCKMH